MAALVVLLAVALVAATISLVMMRRSGRAGEPLVTRTAVTLPQGLSLSLATRPPLAISRDGTKIVIAARRKGVDQLYLRLIGEFEPRPLSGTEGAVNPFFSPDGA